jgi:hypothetical protein
VFLFVNGRGEVVFSWHGAGSFVVGALGVFRARGADATAGFRVGEHDLVRTDAEERAVLFGEPVVVEVAGPPRHVPDLDPGCPGVDPWSGDMAEAVPAHNAVDSVGYDKQQRC